MVPPEMQFFHSSLSPLCPSLQNKTWSNAGYNYAPGKTDPCVAGKQQWNGYQYPGLITTHPTGTEVSQAPDSHPTPACSYLTPGSYPSHGSCTPRAQRSDRRLICPTPGSQSPVTRLILTQPSLAREFLPFPSKPQHLPPVPQHVLPQHVPSVL